MLTFLALNSGMEKNLISLFLSLDFTIGYRNKATTRAMKCGSLRLLVSEKRDHVVDHLVPNPNTFIFYLKTQASFFLASLSWF